MNVENFGAGHHRRWPRFPINTKAVRWNPYLFNTSPQTSGVSLLAPEIKNVVATLRGRRISGEA